MGAARLWARADIRRRWTSLVVLGLLVALAVGSVLALLAGIRRTDRAVDGFVHTSGMAELIVFTESEPSAELLAALGADPRITRVERSDLVVIAPAPIEPGEAGFTLVGVDSVTGATGRPLLVSGRYPAAVASDEIVVNERAASTYGLRAGQRVPLRAIGCFVGCPPEVIGEATIVGVVRLATDLVADPTSQGLTLAGPSFLDGRWRAYPRPDSATWLHLRDRRDAAAVAADVSLRIDDGEVTDNLGSLQVAERASHLQRNALVVGAVVTGIVGVLVVALAVARHLGGRSDDPSTLAAMGLTRRERGMAGTLSVGPALGGGLLAGVALAAAASPLLPLGLARRADPDVGLHADAAALLVGSAGAVVVLLVVTVLVAARWVRPSRVAAASERPSMATQLARRLGLRPVPATGSSMALERRNGGQRLPVVATLVVLASAVAVVVGAMVVRWSLDGLIDGPNRYGQVWDVRVGFAAEELREGAERLAADPRVAAVAISRQGEVELMGGSGSTAQVGTTGIEALTGPVALTVLDGRAPSGPREIAMASSTMSGLGLRVGDRTMAAGACGSFEMTVVGRVSVPLTGNDDPDEGSIMTLGALDELCAQDLVASTDVNNNALIRFHDDRTAPIVREEWRAEGLYVNDRTVPGSITSLADIRQVPLLVVVLVGLLGTAAAAHALVLGVRRRQRDFAVLRALGLRPLQAGGIVRWQATTLALAAVIVGVPLGLVLGRVVWTAIARPSNVLVLIDVKVLGLVLLVAVVAAIAALLSIWPAHRAARLHPAAILRSE